MDPQFWIERWQRNEIGFHQDAYNDHLTKFWLGLGLPADSSVFVPLCGKSKDMVWLHERGHTVWGVDLSEIAVEAFFAEQGLTTTRSSVGALELLEAERYKIFRGDLFNVGESELPAIDAIYDRASLVALPADVRARYACHIAALLRSGARMLLICIDYAQSQMQGPPFAVAEHEVHGLFDEYFDVQRLYTRDVLEDSPRFRERGLTSLEEHVYFLTRNSTRVAAKLEHR